MFLLAVSASLIGRSELGRLLFRRILAKLPTELGRSFRNLGFGGAIAAEFWFSACVNMSSACDGPSSAKDSTEATLTTELRLLKFGGGDGRTEEAGSEMRRKDGGRRP